MPEGEVDEREFYNTPEKAFVRDRWLHYARERARVKGTSTVNLFTLPGVQCLDVNLLRANGLIAMLGPTQYNPNGLTFCEYDPERYGKIREKLTFAKQVRQRYEQFVGTDRRVNAARTADSCFPYDVMNLDFQGPLLRPRGLLDAISRTTRIQSDLHRSFTLFLTVKCDEELEAEDRLRQLKAGLDGNLTSATTSEFRERFLRRYPSYPATPLAFDDLMLVSIPKYLIKDGVSHFYDAACRERLVYVGQGHSTKMLSFIFTYEYVGMGEDLSDAPRDDALTAYPTRISQMIATDYIDINRHFEEHQDIRNQYLAVVESNTQEMAASN